MNRYQLELARMDMRHRLIVRTATFVAAATIMMLALWSAGLSPSDWLARARDWIASRAAAPLAQPVPAANETPGVVSALPVASPAAHVLPGNESSDKPMQLFLVSASPGRNAQEGTAQIGTNPENPQTYVAGAILVNRARLKEIHADHVVLERDGKRARLYTKTRQGSSPGSADDLTIVAPARPAATTKIELAHDALTDFIRPMAHFENDMLVGLQVFPGQHSGVFSRLGLRAGDVIVAIEGAPIADDAAATEALRALTDGAALTVDLRRGKDFMTLSLDGSFVASSIANKESSNQSQMLAGPPPQ
jgi:general secretion pathway protein C